MRPQKLYEHKLNAIIKLLRTECKAQPRPLISGATLLRFLSAAFSGGVLITSGYLGIRATIHGTDFFSYIDSVLVAIAGVWLFFFILHLGADDE